MSGPIRARKKHGPTRARSRGSGMCRIFLKQAQQARHDSTRHDKIKHAKLNKITPVPYFELFGSARQDVEWAWCAPDPFRHTTPLVCPEARPGLTHNHL